MQIRYKIDVLSALKSKGYTTYRLRKEKLIGESYVQQIRNGELVSWEIMTRLCNLLNCDISEIIHCVPDSSEEENPAEP